MKKITLLSLLLTSLVFGEAQVYMGLGYGLSNEESQSANSARIKAGYGSREAYAVEFSMDYIDSNPNKYAFDINFIKAFDWDLHVNPFVKLGFGAGTQDKQKNSSKSLTYGSFNAGTGIYIPMGKNLDIEIAYEYKNLSYEKEDQLNAAKNTSSHVNLGYIGLNARF